LTGVGVGNAGGYDLVVSSPFGMVTSPEALLTVGTTLAVTQVHNQLVFSWVSPWILQTSTNAFGPYTDLTGAASPFTNLIGTEPKNFFRLRCGIASRISAAGFTSGRFAVDAAGAPGYNYVIEASTNLLQWSALETNAAPFQFIDINASNYPARFYRTRITR
jgi:hypothetical protein